MRALSPLMPCWSKRWLPNSVSPCRPSPISTSPSRSVPRPIPTFPSSKPSQVLGLSSPPASSSPLANNAHAMPLPPNCKNMETLVKTPGLSSPCPMEYCKGLLTAFGLGFTPHIQRKARTDLCLRPHPVDTLLHLAIASVAPLHRIRGGGQQLVVEKREGLFQRGGKEFLECLTQLWEPLKPTPQLGQFGQSALGPTAP